MFERYTEKARRVIFFGRYEASQFGSPYIETEHLLLGILREDKALTSRLLKSSGSIEAIRLEIENHSPIREKVPTSVDLPVSNECKRIFAYAAEEADRLHHEQIEVEHLLLGLLREEKCFAAALLERHGVGLASARKAIMKTPAESPPAPAEVRSEFPRLADFGISLTQQAMDRLLPPLIGRERELDRVIRVLCRLTRANPVLVGEPGVGKKSIVNGLAHRIVEGNVPVNLANSSLIIVDLAVIAAGTKSRLRFEENLDQILVQLLQGDSVLFFVNGLYSFAQTQRFLSLVNVMKPALISGSILCISTATPAEYLKTIEAAPWLEQLFTVIDVGPASEAEVLTVLRGLKERFERFHGVTYTDDALRYAVFHSNSHFPNRHLPEKAVDLIDEAGARAKLEIEVSDEVAEVKKKIKLILEHQDRAIINHEFENARSCADELRKERENLKLLTEKNKIDESTLVVTRQHIERIVAERTGVAMEKLQKTRASEAPGDQKGR